MSADDDVKARAVEVLVSAPSTRSGLWGFADRRSLQIARDVVAELAAARLLANPGALARAKAEAWAEGKAAGCSGRSDRDEWLAGLGPRPWLSENPYLRADRIDPTEGETS